MIETINECKAYIGIADESDSVYLDFEIDCIIQQIGYHRKKIRNAFQKDLYILDNLVEYLEILKQANVFISDSYQFCESEKLETPKLLKCFKKMIQNFCEVANELYVRLLESQVTA